ncbi:MAG: hypothetical protein Aurels2KO_12860 [Aureliella sp.]
MTRSANEILDAEFLQVRAKILEIGAFFDRLEEAGRADSEKLAQLKSACEMLTDESSGKKKAAQIQLLFSREYDASWRDAFGI